MVTIKNAQIYSSQGEMCYELEYSEGSKVRAVESAGNIIRKEYKDGNEWKLSGKPYVVIHNKKRQAEKIKDSVKEFIGS